MSYELYDIKAPTYGYYLTHEQTDLTLRFETLEEAKVRAKVYYDEIPHIRQSISYGDAAVREPRFSDEELRSEVE